jgi:hypothetical protein
MHPIHSLRKQKAASVAGRPHFFRKCCFYFLVGVAAGVAELLSPPAGGKHPNGIDCGCRAVWAYVLANFYKFFLFFC